MGRILVKAFSTKILATQQVGQRGVVVTLLFPEAHRKKKIRFQLKLGNDSSTSAPIRPTLVNPTKTAFEDVTKIQPICDHQVQLESTTSS